MDIVMYFYSENSFYKWRVFKVMRDGDKLIWQLIDLFGEEEYVKSNYPSAILYPFKGTGYELDFDKEEFEKACGGVPSEH